MIELEENKDGGEADGERSTATQRKEGISNANDEDDDVGSRYAPFSTI